MVYKVKLNENILKSLFHNKSLHLHRKKIIFLISFCKKKQIFMYVYVCMCIHTVSFVFLPSYSKGGKLYNIYLLSCSLLFHLIIHLGCNIQSIDIFFIFFQLHTFLSSFLTQISFPQMTFRWFPYFAFANNDKMNNLLHILVFSFGDLFQDEFLEVELILSWNILPISPPCGCILYTPTSNL